MSVSVAARVCAMWVAVCSLGCAPEGAGDAGPGGPLPPDPTRFSVTTCTFEDNGGGSLALGLDWERFTAAGDGDSLQFYEVDGRLYAYFSLRVTGIEPSSACVEYNLSLAEPDEPNEIIAFGRYEVMLEGDVAGAELLGVPMPLAASALDIGKRALLEVTAAEPVGASASAQLSVVVKGP